MSEQRHLKRLASSSRKSPVYFITTCVSDRKTLLASPIVVKILVEEWSGLRRRHGWTVGRYVVMPDHVHFFIAPALHAEKGLSYPIGKWKEWTAKRILKALGRPAPLWQPEFFDHLLRSSESMEQKWNYVRENPVRAGLVTDPRDWPYAGSVDFEGF